MQGGSSVHLRVGVRVTPTRSTVQAAELGARRALAVTTHPVVTGGDRRLTDRSERPGNRDHRRHNPVVRHGWLCLVHDRSQLVDEGVVEGGGFR